jgi:hypothetical protein
MIESSQREKHFLSPELEYHDSKPEMIDDSPIVAESSDLVDWANHKHTP